MKIAVASLVVASLAVASAFAPGKHAFVRQPTNLNMSSPAEFVKTEIAAHDVSFLSFIITNCLHLVVYFRIYIEFSLTYMVIFCFG